jgi:Vacuolar sorting-associated protein 13, N-terminal/Vacuolar-sorting-associated 13 protein C-terminal/N-terminal region of Chorein or VPS13/SHR-binding domain of vacuolar-sorting associated protein 13/UBA/TS-N domain
MLESLLADVLTRVLGQYVSGIDRDSISFGVWGGCLELRDLTLRAESVALIGEKFGLDIPVTAVAGYIGLLRITVPWKTLASTPVTVHIERMTVVARPVTGDQSGASELANRERRLARARLDTDDAVREAAWAVRTGAPTANKDPPSGWAARLVSRIVDNIQIEIEDVVVRYEDALSDRRRPYCVALLCERVRAVSADRNWRQAFIDDPLAPLTRKIIDVAGFRVNWGPLHGDTAAGTGQLELDQFDTHHELRKFVDGGHGSDGDKHSQAIITPFNGMMRASMVKDAKDRALVQGAAVELDIDFPDVEIVLNDVQYASLLQTSVYFAKLATRGFRPESTKERWVWAVEQLLPGFRERARAAKCLTVEEMCERNKLRQLYIAARSSLLKARRTGVAEPADMARKVEAMEAEMSFEDVVMYRDMTDDQIAVVSQTWEKMDEAPPAGSTTGSGTKTSAFWSYLGYSDTGASVKTDAAVASGVDAGAAIARKRIEDEDEFSDARLNEPHGPAAVVAMTGSDGLGLSECTKEKGASVRAGILLRKIGIQMHRGGFPDASEPMVELILRDLRLGVTVSAGEALLLEGVLGTCEAWNLQSGTAMVYPRVPWNPQRSSRAQLPKSFVSTVGVDAVADAVADTVAVDDNGYDSENGRAGHIPPGAPTDVAGMSSRISNSSYPSNVGEALESIRYSFIASTAPGDPESTPRHSRRRTKATGIDADDDLSEEEWASLRSDRESGAISLVRPSDATSSAASVSTAKLSSSCSTYISEAEFLGSGFLSRDASGGDDGGRAFTGSQFESLEYLIAFRICQEGTAFGDDWGGKSSGGTSGTVVDVAVGRLEAVVDGPKGTFLWGLRFWQPKGTAEDPIMAFLGAAAGARLAALRMELENALLARHAPMRIDAVICAPRFVLLGRTGTSSALVMNMGTFGFDSPRSHVGATEPEASAATTAAGGERYSSYTLSLDDLGVYLAPNYLSAISRRVTRPSESGTAAGNLFGLDPSPPANTDGVERIIRPFSLRVVLLTLQDAQVVEVAHHPKAQSGQSNRIAKLRLRGRIPGIRLVLSQRACHHLISAGKRWSSGLVRESPRSIVNVGRVQIEEPLAVGLPERDEEDGIYASLAAIEAKFTVDTVSLELRDRGGSRIVTLLAAGMRAKVLKTGSDELTADFRLQSWTVTDGSRGTTAAFRRLAYAGGGAEERAVSPPHSLAASQTMPGRSDEDGEASDAFVQVRLRQQFSTGDAFASIRFLSLHMLCVRETYAKIAAFCYGTLKDMRTCRRAEKSFASRLDVSDENESAASAPDATPASARSEALSGDRPLVPIVVKRPKGKLVLKAVLDGFTLQLVSVEGALACIEMSKFAINAEKLADGSVLASGDVGYVAIRDLTSPLVQHADSLIYQRSAEMLDRMRTGVTDDVDAADGWSVTVPPAAGLQDQVFVRARFRGMRVLFLTRFVNVLSRYFSVLQQGLQPAVDEVRAVAAETPGLGSTVIPTGTVNDGTQGKAMRYLFEMVAEDVVFRLPRHSACHQEAVVLSLQSVHVSNERQPSEGYCLSARLRFHGVLGKLAYVTPEDSDEAISEKANFLECSTAEYRIDMWRDLPEVLEARNSEITGEGELPAMRGRLSVDNVMAISLCEAQYTVLYFVLTENFAETIDGGGTDFARSSLRRDMDSTLPTLRSLGQDDADTPIARYAVNDQPSPVGASQPDVDSILLHLVFEMSCVRLLVARGWNVGDRSCYVLSSLVNSVRGFIDVTSLSRIAMEMTSQLAEILDVRHEAVQESDILLLPLADLGGTASESSGEDVEFPSESVSLRYDKLYGKRANVAVLLSSIQLRIIPELLRDLSCLAVPGWPFLESSPLAPEVEYLGRIMTVSLSRSQVWLGAEQYVGDPRALLLGGEVTARVNWMQGTGAKKTSVQAKGLNIALTCDPKHVVSEDADGGSPRRVALRVSSQDALVMYPGDGSLEYIGPDVDESGRRLQILADFVLCRINVKEAPLIASIFNRLGCVRESYLSQRDWTQVNTMADAQAAAVTGSRSTLSSEQALATRKTLTVLMSTPAARLLFTDESKGQFVPILEWNMRNAMVQANMPRVVQFASEWSVNLFNEAKGWWEPGLELWAVELSMSTGESGSRAYAITSATNMSINVTPSTMGGASRVVSALQTASAAIGSDGVLGAEDGVRKPANQRPSVAAFHVCNCLGIPVTMWLPHDPVRKALADGGEVQVDMPRDSLVPGASEHHEGDDNTSRERTLRCTLSIAGFVPLELSAAEVGAHAIYLRRDAAAGTAVLVDLLGHDRVDENGDQRPVSVVWEVVMRAGVPICTVRSPVRLLNETKTAFEVSLRAFGQNDLFESSSDATPGDIRVVEPGSSFSVPMQSLETHIRVRPVIYDAPDYGRTSSDDLDAILGESRIESDEEDNPFFASSPRNQRRKSSIAGWSNGEGVVESGYSYDWSSPLADMSWLSATAHPTAASGSSTAKRSGAAVAFFQAFNPGMSTASASSSRTTSRHTSEHLCCRSGTPHAADFYIITSPRTSSLTASNEFHSAEPPCGWLDIALQAPVVLENLLPGLLSYQFSAANGMIMGSGVLQPFENLHLHSCRLNEEEDANMALAFENSAEVAADPDLNDESVFGFNGDVDPPTAFGIPQSLRDLVRDRRGVFVEPLASASSRGSQSKRDAKELCVRVTGDSASTSRLSVWSQFWIRNRSDVNLEVCGRGTYYSPGTAVRSLPPCPPGLPARKHVCFEGPYISLRRTEDRDAEWWTYQSDLADVVKPISIAIPRVSLVMEVRPAAGPLPNTMVVIIRNASWIVNRTPLSFQWCQSSALDSHGNARLRHVQTLQSGEAHPIHWDSKSDVRAVNLRLSEEEDEGFSGWFWSPPVPMAMGNKGEFPAKMYRPKSQEQYIARVVAIKLHGGSSSLFVYPQDTENPPYRVVNLCRYRSIAFHQIGSEDRPWLVRPGKSTRYSWDDPLASNRRRELRVEVIEALPVNWSRKDLDPSGYVAGAAGSISGSGGLSEWDGISNAVAASWAAGRQYHHPKFNLNIDIVREKPIAKKGTFEPALHACITVDRATKVVTFRDADQLNRAQDLATSPSSNRVDTDAVDVAFTASVPTVGWDDEMESASTSVGDERNKVQAGDIYGDKGSDYPQKSLDIQSSGADAKRDSLDVDMNVFLSGVGISVIDSTPLELAYAYARNVFLKHERHDSSSQTTFDVTELQIDNQLPNAAFPVLLWAPLPDPHAGEEQSPGPIRTLALEASQVSSDGGITMWKSVRAAVRPLAVAIDEEFVLRMIDFGSDVAKGADEPERESVTGLDGEHHSLGDHYEAIAEEIASASKSADGSRQVASRHAGLARIYVEELKLFPFKLFLSSTASRGSMRSAGYKSSSLRTLVAILLNVENCEFDFAALELRHVFDSSQHFGILVREYYLTQLNNQRMKLLASNSLIGNPAALFDSVSIGARDLFVEPGRAKGSAEFLASVGRGSRSMLANTVGGLVGSIGGIPKAVSSGLETAVGDRQYLAERERIRSHQFSGGLRPLSSTPAQGMATGAMSFAHGISSGVTGIFTDPVRGAQRGGAAGFFKGVGKGLVGGIVKPVAGVMDLIAEPVAGISKSVGGSGARRRGKVDVDPIRPPRSFRGNGMRLVSYDMRAATGEALLKAALLLSSLRAEEDLLEWVELSDRPGRQDPDAVNILWRTIQRYSRTARGSRRARADSPSASENMDGSSSYSLPLSSLAPEVRMEKIRVGLVLERRVIVATLDGTIVSNTAIEESPKFEILDDGKVLVLQTARRAAAGVEKGKDIIHVWGRLPCGSTEAREELHAAVDRAVMSLRRRRGGHNNAWTALRSSRDEMATSIELGNVASGRSSRSSGNETEMASLESSAAADGTPDVFGTASNMPGRDSRGRPVQWYPGSTQDRSSRGGAEQSAAAAARRELELTAAVRRLKMGGTNRAADSKRSVRVIVANALPSGNTVRLIRSSLEDGFWREQPPNEIPAGNAKLFEADSGGADDNLEKWQMNRDVRGSVVLGVSADKGSGSASTSPVRTPQIALDFVNPVMSSPSYAVQCSPGIYATHDRGAGAHATIVFTISDQPAVGPTSLLVAQSPSVSLRTSLRTSRDSLSSAVALPLASQSRSAPTLPTPPSVPAGAGRLFRAGSQRLREVANALGGVAAGVGAAAGRAGSSSGTGGVDAASVAQLVELGFPRDAATAALRDTDGDLVQAVDLLTR